jgi:hypothetical protein
MYVTGSVHSIIGGLIEISNYEDDMESFINGTRFRMRVGDASKSRTGRATTFVEIDLAAGSTWNQLTNSDTWRLGPSTLPRLIADVTKIKAAFRRCSWLQDTPAVIGEALLYDEISEVIETGYTTV